MRDSYILMLQKAKSNHKNPSNNQNNNLINQYSSIISFFSNDGTPQVQSSSISRLSPPILIRKKPSSPQYVPQLFLPIQYSSPSSVTPHPTNLVINSIPTRL